jgi:uncharacterized protein YkwD/LysM repeat protein
MSRRAVSLVSAVVLVIFAAFGSASTSRAEPEEKPALAGSPLDLVNAVNALRASLGLPLYSINPILMATAQAQADFLAVTGSMTHFGPNGIGLTDRLLAAGYPLAGDLSLGGFRSENITGGDETMPPEAAVDRWTGDAPHLNTMASQNLTEIGAGVAINNGRVYYVIDCALPTTNGLPQMAGDPGEAVSPVPEIAAIIYPVTLSTPDAEGHLIHEVKPGQTLWQIAISYETKIDELKRLNNLFDNNIYPGNKLLVKTGLVLPTVLPTETPVSTPTSQPTLTITAQNVVATSTPIRASQSALKNATVMNALIGIVILALLGGGLFTWAGRPKKE